MADSIWIEEDKKLLSAIKDIKIPNNKLESVLYKEIRNNADLDEIPNNSGCYWIWTNEPVRHFLHKHKVPDPISGGEIIYNGISQKSIRGRIENHLFSSFEEGRSGISLDIYTEESGSHRKKALSETGKVPYIQLEHTLNRSNSVKNLKKGDMVLKYTLIRNKDSLLILQLSDKEKVFIKETDFEKIHFRNGINLTEEKHKNYKYVVYFIDNISVLYLNHIEKKWRESYGLPKLCSYSSGR